MARPELLLPRAAAILELVDARGLLAVRVSANASADAVILPANDSCDTLVIRTTAPPERGKANQAVLRLLVDTLGRPISALQLVRGASRRDKLVRVIADQA